MFKRSLIVNYKILLLKQKLLIGFIIQVALEFKSVAAKSDMVARSGPPRRCGGAQCVVRRGVGAMHRRRDVHLHGGHGGHGQPRADVHARGDSRVLRDGAAVAQDVQGASLRVN